MSVTGSKNNIILSGHAYSCAWSSTSTCCHFHLPTACHSSRHFHNDPPPPPPPPPPPTPEASIQKQYVLTAYSHIISFIWIKNPTLRRETLSFIRDDTNDDDDGGEGFSPKRRIFNPNEADNVRTCSKILCQLIITYLPTVQGFPGLSRDLGICPGVQGFSPFVQGFWIFECMVMVLHINWCIYIYIYSRIYATSVHCRISASPHWYVSDHIGIHQCIGALVPRCIPRQYASALVHCHISASVHQCISASPHRYIITLAHYN